MRIRKNKNLSSLIYPQVESVHICKLNQSTWDVTPLPEEAYQFEDEDSFDRNGSIGDSIDVVESVAIMKVRGGTDIDDNVDDNENDYDIAIELAKQFEESNKVALLKSCNKNETERYDSRLSGGRRGGQVRATRKGSSSASISNDFYYYSGFGPSKGRRRGGGGGDSEVDNNNGSVITAQHNSTVSSSSQYDNNEEFDYVDDDDEDEDENGDSGKKRMRKPIKERSLKSLM